MTNSSGEEFGDSFDREMNNIRTDPSPGLYYDRLVQVMNLHSVLFGSLAILRTSIDPKNSKMYHSGASGTVVMARIHNGEHSYGGTYPVNCKHLRHLDSDSIEDFYKYYDVLIPDPTFGSTTVRVVEDGSSEEFQFGYQEGTGRVIRD